LLTEKEVARSWGQIFKKGQVAADSFDRAEELLEELRSESPLRHRLSLELEELRKIYTKHRAVVSQHA
jgi:predicted DNA-binding WGR domain protein